LRVEGNKDAPELALEADEPGLLSKAHAGGGEGRVVHMSVFTRQLDPIRKLVRIISERRIPYRIARKWSRAPQQSLLWRLAKRLYSKPSGFFKYFGLFPLPVQPVSYEQFGSLQFAAVRPFPASAVPKSVHRKEDWIGWRSRTERLRGHTIPSCHTVLVPNGFADALGNVFSEDGSLVLGASLPVRGHVNEYYTPQRILPPIYRAKSLAVVTSSLQGGYYHWLMDVLPRIHMVLSQGMGTDCFFVQAKYGFQRETLRLLGITNTQLINTEDYEFVSARELVVPFHEVGPRMEHPKWVCDFLRGAFLPIATQQALADPVRRLYISRNDARWRRVINELEVMQVLEPLGFRRITLGQLSFTEQVRLFQNAEVVIGPHGAGLSNLAFCQPGTKVIEFQQLKLDVCFFRLSCCVGLDHYYIRSSTGPADPVNNHQQITIDMTELRKTLELAAIY
jgi:glycosyl transferase family 61